MLFLIGAASIIIWLLIFTGGLIFRERKLPYLWYVLASGFLTIFLWDSYQISSYETDTKILAAVIGVVAALGIILFLIGEVTWENLDYPFGRPDSDTKSPTWQKLLSIASVIFFFWLVFSVI